jgi:hypothetical protein
MRATDPLTTRRCVLPLEAAAAAPGAVAGNNATATATAALHAAAGLGRVGADGSAGGDGFAGMAAARAALAAHTCADGASAAACALDGGTCAVLRDGYDVLSVGAFALGLAWLLGYGRPAIRRLQALPPAAWKAPPAATYLNGDAASGKGQ